MPRPWELTEKAALEIDYRADEFDFVGIAKAAQQQLVEWQDGECIEHTTSGFIPPLRHLCFHCQQQLRNSLGSEEL